MSLRHFIALSLIASALVGVLGGCSDDDTTSPPTYTVIETFAGTGIPGISADGLLAQQSMLNLPQDMVFGPNGGLYIADWNNHRITVVGDSFMYMVCGNGTPGDPVPGSPSEIQLNHPSGVVFAPDGSLIIFAWQNSKIMSLDFASDFVDRIAGTSTGSGYGGDGGEAIST